MTSVLPRPDRSDGFMAGLLGVAFLGIAFLLFAVAFVLDRDDVPGKLGTTTLLPYLSFGFVLVGGVFLLSSLVSLLLSVRR